MIITEASNLPFFACNMSAGSGGKDEQWLGLKLDCIDENGLPALDGYLRITTIVCKCAIYWYIYKVKLHYTPHGLLELGILRICQ